MTIAEELKRAVILRDPNRTDRIIARVAARGIDLATGIEGFIVIKRIPVADATWLRDRVEDWQTGGSA